VDHVDTSYLQTLMGYNARRAALSIIELFLERLAPYGLKPVDFSVMSTICHNPGVTSRQLCATLNLLPPNLVGLIQSLEARGLIERKPHPHDGRAVGLHPTPQGQALMVQAEQTAADLELEKPPASRPRSAKRCWTCCKKFTFEPLNRPLYAPPEKFQCGGCSHGLPRCCCQQSAHPRHDHQSSSGSG